jgi:hypothetical protein
MPGESTASIAACSSSEIFWYHGLQTVSDDAGVHPIRPISDKSLLHALFTTMAQQKVKSTRRLRSRAVGLVYFAEAAGGGREEKSQGRPSRLGVIHHLSVPLSSPPLFSRSRQIPCRRRGVATEPQPHLTHPNVSDLGESSSSNRPGLPETAQCHFPHQSGEPLQLAATKKTEARSSCIMAVMESPDLRNLAAFITV